jgi:glycosyltransferase involved in cell wall biosynthesis
MKILHITKGVHGGLDIISKELFTYLKNKHQQKILYLAKEGSGVYSEFEASQAWSFLLWEEVVFVNLYSKIRELYAADIIHVHHTKTWLIFSPLCFFAKKNIFSFHMSFGSGVKKSILSSFLIGAIITYCTLFSKKLIFLTEGQKNKLKSLSIFKNQFEQKSEIIPNFINESKMLAEKLNFNIKTLFVGRYSKIKGYEDLISLSNQLPNSQFYTIGEDQKLINRKNNLINFGRVNHDNIFEYYDKNTILILPSYTEAFPLVILEAMARGLVILVSDIPGMRDIVKEGRNGFLFPPGDVSKIKDILLRLERSANLISEISKNNITDVRKYGKGMILPLYEKIYE